jgi:hypothetical protein
VHQKEDAMAVVMESLVMKEDQETLAMKDGQWTETLLMEVVQEILLMKDGQEIESLVLKED